VAEAAQAWDTLQADMAVGPKDAIHLAHASGRSVVYQALSLQDGKMNSGSPVEVAKTSSPSWPSVACLGDKVWIAYADGARVYVRSSADSGRTWADVPAVQAAFTHGAYPCLVSTPRGLVCLVGSETGVAAATVPGKGEMAWQDVVTLPAVNHNFTAVVDGTGAIHLFASPQANLAKDGAMVHAIGAAVGGDGKLKWSMSEPVTTRPAEGLAATALGDRMLLVWSRTLDTEQGEICWRVWDCRAGKWVGGQPGDENSLTSDRLWYCHPKLPPMASQTPEARLVPLVWMHPGDLRAWAFQVDRDGVVGPRRVER
jgi:hypothetical protein